MMLDPREPALLLAVVKFLADLDPQYRAQIEADASRLKSMYFYEYETVSEASSVTNALSDINIIVL